MNLDLPDEIKDVVELLESFEKSDNHQHRTRDFIDAIEVINEYVSANPESSRKPFIQNLKSTYIHRLLQQLPNFRDITFKDWFHYFVLFIELDKDIKILIESNPDLKKGKSDFLDLWLTELTELLESSKRN